MTARPVTVLLCLLFNGLAPAAALASTMGALHTNATGCLQNDHLPSCQAALLQAESLARRAAARSAFPCQTLLLGVQADLIMQQLGDGRGPEAVNDLAAAGRGCAGL